MNLDEKFKKLVSRSFFRDVTFLQVGSVFSTGLAFVTSVVLARLLHADGYGLYGLTFSFVSLVAIFMDWGGDDVVLTLLPAAYAEKNFREIKSILTYYIKINVIIALTIGLVAMVFAPWLADLVYHRSVVGQLGRVVLLSNIVGSFFLMTTLALQAVRKIKRLTAFESLNKLLGSFIPAILVFLGLGLTGLVLGHLLVSVLFLFLSLYLYSAATKKVEYLPTLEEIVRGFWHVKIKKYLRFGFPIALNKRLSNLYSLLPVTLVGFLGSSVEVSFFKIALSYATLPLILFSPIARILAVQLPKSRIQGMDTLKDHFYKTSLRAGLISLVAILPVILLAPFLVKSFYGIEYLPSVKLSYILVVVTVASGFSIGIGPIYKTLNRMKAALIINALVALAGVIFAAIIFRTFSISAATTVAFMVVFWAVVGTICQFIYIKRILARN